MGPALREMYGNQMVVFGFSFNQGSFQAVSQTGRGLKNFTVPEAPAGSLDATLAASGIPLFALDLRSAPKTGPVGEWLVLRTARAVSVRCIRRTRPTRTSRTRWRLRHSTRCSLWSGRARRVRMPVGRARRPKLSTSSWLPIDRRDGIRDPELAVSVTVAQGWKVGEAFRWGDHETTARLLGPGEHRRRGALFQDEFQWHAQRGRGVHHAGAQSGVEGSAARGCRHGDYRIRAGSVERRTVGGRPALSCVADFTRNGAKMVEYLTWVSGEHASAQFFAQVAASELNGLRHRLDSIIETLELP